MKKIVKPVIRDNKLTKHLRLCALNRQIKKLVSQSVAQEGE